MEVPTSDAMTQLQISEPLISKPVPRPFSIEALMSDDNGPKRSVNSATCWGPIISHQIGQLAPVESVEGFHQRELRDTDSEDGSLDMEMAQDLSNRSQKDGGKRRTAFTSEQLLELEREFHAKKYLSLTERSQIAAALRLSTGPHQGGNKAGNQQKGKLVVPIPVHVNRFAVRSQHQQLERALGDLAGRVLASHAALRAGLDLHHATGGFHPHHHLHHQAAPPH
nr:unnamed protein product [Callosobruchus analis]